jgi:hypothetical protein
MPILMNPTRFTHVSLPLRIGNIHGDAQRGPGRMAQEKKSTMDAIVQVLHSIDILHVRFAAQIRYWLPIGHVI